MNYIVTSKDIRDSSAVIFDHFCIGSIMYINCSNSIDPLSLLCLRSALKIGHMCLLEIFNCFSVNHQSNIANERSRRFRGYRPHPPIIQVYD